MLSIQFYNRIKKNISETHTSVFYLESYSLVFKDQLYLETLQNECSHLFIVMSSVITSNLNGVNTFLQVKWEEVELEANTGEDSGEHE